MIKRLEHMKESLMNCVQGQLGDLSSVDAEELGAAIDMIKDLSEAVYYCTIVESMDETKKEKEKEKGKEKETVMYYPMPMPMQYAEGQGGGGQGQGGGRRGYRDMDYAMGRMYYEGPTSYAQGGSGSGSGSSGGGNSGGGQGGSGGGGGSRGYQDGNRQSSGESRNFPYREYPIELRD